MAMEIDAERLIPYGYERDDPASMLSALKAYHVAHQLVWSTRHGYYVPRWQAAEEDRIAAIAYDEARRRRQDECPHEWW
jgi:hypothetical protein